MADFSRRVAALGGPPSRLALDIAITVLPGFDPLRTRSQQADDSRREAARATGRAPAPDFRGEMNSGTREVRRVPGIVSEFDETPGGDVVERDESTWGLSSARAASTRPKSNGLGEYR
ncbi:hypothetical protein LTR95_004371 [Oleoguttula sp. CCFEE 5521]